MPKFSQKTENVARFATGSWGGLENRQVGNTGGECHTVTNRIGPLECDRQTIRPITFQVSPPLAKHFLWGILPDGNLGKIQGI